MDSKFRRILILIVTAATTALCVVIILTVNLIHQSPVTSIIVQPSLSDTNTEDNLTATPPSSTAQSPETPQTPPFINLQPVLDQWLATLNSNEQAGVMIYDLTNQRTAASYHAEQVFNVASIYKLLFAYDGYRQIALGLDDPDAIFARTSDKGNLTLSQCLDLTIRESYNGCADRLASNSTRIKRVTQLIKDLNMQNTTNIGLQSTAADLTKLLIFYWQHYDLPDELWQQLSDSMLNQPPASASTHPTYDWRQGLPAGFSDQVKVYNKVGWEWNGERWNIYADAAILDFTTDEHIYTVAVLTKNFTSYTKISQLGTLIEEAITTQSQ